MTSDDRPESDYIELSNEFASVKVRKVATRNGERLEIWSPRQGHRILLCPLELESLTWQPPEVFSNFLVNPFGPEPEFDDEGT